jgi:hypothetical protein
MVLYAIYSALRAEEFGSTFCFDFRQKYKRNYISLLNSVTSSLYKVLMTSFVLP